MYRSAIPSWTTNGILSDPDVHPQSPDRYSILGFILDQYGCCSSQGSFGDNYCADYDHTEFRVTSFLTKGKCTKWTYTCICADVYACVYICMLYIYVSFCQLFSNSIDYSLLIFKAEKLAKHRNRWRKKVCKPMISSIHSCVMTYNYLSINHTLIHYRIFMYRFLNI